MSEQIAPYSQEAEEAVLGAVIVNPTAYVTIAAFLKSDDFFFVRHRYIWESLERLQERREIIDYLTVVQELKDMSQLDAIGGPAYITQLISITPSSAHAEIYGRIVERTAVRRRLMEAAEKIRHLAADESLTIESVTSEAEIQLFNVTDRQVKREFTPLSDVVSAYFERVEYLMHNQQESFGIPSGFRDLDEMLGGFQRSDLLIFAGRPGMGKCVAEGTMIATERGLVPIETLKPNDLPGIPDDEGGMFYPLEIDVQTPDGPRRTSYFYDSGVRPTLRITTRAGYTLTGTHHHPVLVLDPSGCKIWKRLDEIRSGDFVAVQPQQLVSEERFAGPVQVKAASATPSVNRTGPALILQHTIPLCWDEVVQAEDSGVRHCYDLTVPDGHSFVANGIVSHNTSFLLSIAVNIARIGGRVAIFTMEMGADQLVQRILSMETGINSQQMRLGRLTPRDFSLFVEASGRVSDFRIFIDDTPALTPAQMRTKCRRLMHEHGIDMVIVDYLQLMNSGGVYQNNRVQEVSFISRALKELARELNVPMISAAQLSRAVEQRQDKRPVLSDLRESGCLAGESLVFLPDEGRYVPMHDLVGKAGFRVLSINTDTMKLEVGTATAAFSTGIKPIYRITTQLGRTIRATANHKFLTIEGWKRLDELTDEDYIAIPRLIPSSTTQTMTDDELGLLGHLLGDGCTLPTHAIQYTTADTDVAEIVAQLSVKIFGDAVRPRIHKEVGRNWYQVFLGPTKHLTHNVRNPVRVWLENLGAFGFRSYEKSVPEKVFAQPANAVACFLRHLWATDGCISMKKTSRGYYPVIYFGSSSNQLAKDIQSLLLYVGINARLKRIEQKNKGRDQYHVIVTGRQDLTRFVTCVGAVGIRKNQSLAHVRDYVDTHIENTNRDIIPKHIWRMFAVPSMQAHNITSRQMHQGLETAYCGTTLYKQNVSRERAMRLAQVVHSEEIQRLANSDLYWDTIASIALDGETAVYDLTVEPHHNFVANNIVVHNSIEQDSDIVMFLYRDSVYNEASEFPNQADVIIAKHRNGPTGTVSLYFDPALTKFMDGAVRRVDLGDY